MRFIDPGKSVIWAVVLALAGVVCLACPEATAKSYRITDVAIGADLFGDGSMRVSEARTFSFNGSFTFAYRELVSDGQVALDGFDVLEDGRPYVRSASHEPGTYDITGGKGALRVTWYFTATDDERTFEVRYSARGAVGRYQDAAMLYYKFVGDEWDLPQENVSLRVRPPVALAGDSVQVWLHGPLWAYSERGPDGAIAANCEHLPAHTYLEVRALYPPEIFAEAEPRPGLVRSAVLAEEAAWAEEANRAREIARQKLARDQELEAAGMWIVPVITLVALLVWWFIYRAFGNRPTVPGLPLVASDIPDATPPALVGYLLHSRQVSSSSLVATMFDLAERGFVALRQDTAEVSGLFGRTKTKSVYTWRLNRTFLAQHARELRDFESSLVDFLFKDIGKGSDSVT
ncbi:MAG: DUF2207 domain-containing protein, partial [bacterium]